MELIIDVNASFSVEFPESEWEDEMTEEDRKEAVWECIRECLTDEDVYWEVKK